MDEELRKEVERFIISYIKLYSSELEFMAKIVEHNSEAFERPKELQKDLGSIAHYLMSVLGEYYDDDLIDSIDKAHFVVKIDDNTE